MKVYIFLFIQIVLCSIGYLESQIIEGLLENEDYENDLIGRLLETNHFETKLQGRVSKKART